jgi:hypothetical protein
LSAIGGELLLNVPQPLKRRTAARDRWVQIESPSLLIIARHCLMCLRAVLGSGSDEGDYRDKGKISASKQVRNIRCSSINYQIASYGGIRRTAPTRSGKNTRRWHLQRRHNSGRHN